MFNYCCPTKRDKTVCPKKGLRPVILKCAEKNCENVGDNFAQEARKASLGERDDHIYGKATDKEIKELHNEGIGAIEIPDVKDH